MKSQSGVTQSGVTLIELVITIVIISIALLAVINAFSNTAGRSADPLWQFKTVKLAQLYLDEIISKPYHETTPLGGVPAVLPAAIVCTGLGNEGESRDAFDDVDDFITAGAVAPDIISATGISMDASYADYRISINVVCAGSDLGLANNANAKRIELTIIPPTWVTNGSTMMFSAYRGNF